MLLRRWHRLIGICLLLPCFGWALTGLVFFMKPGYASAFGRLEPRYLPLGEIDIPVVDGTWLECRVLKTVLGTHLLVRDDRGWHHLDAVDGDVWPLPDSASVRLLVEDAVADRRDRFGQVARITENQIFMDSGVRIVLDWQRLALSQEGADTRLLNTLYKIHYLQWTGNAGVDRVLGVAGLVLLVAMAVTGACLLVAGKHRFTS